MYVYKCNAQFCRISIASFAANGGKKLEEHVHNKNGQREFIHMYLHLQSTSAQQNQIISEKECARDGINVEASTATQKSELRVCFCGNAHSRFPFNGGCN